MLQMKTNKVIEKEIQSNWINWLKDKKFSFSREINFEMNQVNN
jgi:hypothetical protein